MGPEAGAGGGRVVTEGPPEDIVIHARQERKAAAAKPITTGDLLRSHTGEALDAFGLLDQPSVSRTRQAIRGRS
jgi:hypothetical protein